jgi:hypothetical protein
MTVPQILRVLPSLTGELTLIGGPEDDSLCKEAHSMPARWQSTSSRWGSREQHQDPPRVLAFAIGGL